MKIKDGVDKVAIMVWGVGLIFILAAGLDFWFTGIWTLKQFVVFLFGGCLAVFGLTLSD